ncbi:MAG: hypothetical protein PHC50_01185 [Candidatus Cloacimonetes bacterium]|nr:hypothetical protein [Candidatus Cloacimonadota bacterium]
MIVDVASCRMIVDVASCRMIVDVASCRIKTTLSFYYPEILKNAKLSQNTK